MNEMNRNMKVANNLIDIIETNQTYRYHITLNANIPIERRLLASLSKLMRERDISFKEAYLTLFAEKLLELER